MSYIVLKKLALKRCLEIGKGLLTNNLIEIRTVRKISLIFCIMVLKSIENIQKYRGCSSWKITHSLNNFIWGHPVYQKIISWYAELTVQRECFSTKFLKHPFWQLWKSKLQDPVYHIYIYIYIYCIDYLPNAVWNCRGTIEKSKWFLVCFNSGSIHNLHHKYIYYI